MVLYCIALNNCRKFLVILVFVQYLDAQRVYTNSQNQYEDDFEHKIEMEHLDDPKTPLELAVEILSNVFVKATSSQNFIKMEDVFERLENSRALSKGFQFPLFTLLRNYELMDLDKDGEITNEEYVQYYGEPVSQPSKSIELMHQILDSDRDGFVTIWENYMALTVDNEAGISPGELWKTSLKNHREMDANQDNLVSKQEFVAFMIYTLQKVVYEQKLARDEF